MKIKPHYRLVNVGETIKDTDTWLIHAQPRESAEALLEKDSYWLPTQVGGAVLKSEGFRPHRRLITPEPTPPMSSPTSLLIIPQPSTKPQRYMLAHNDHIFAKGMTKYDARKIAAALLTAEIMPALLNQNMEALKNAGI